MYREGEIANMCDTLIVFVSADFVRTGNYDLLTGVLLALTGCEAMFARPVHQLIPLVWILVLS